MQIFVKLINGSISYNITKSNDKIIYLKRHIAEILHFEERDLMKIYAMRFIYAGKIMEDSEKISDRVQEEGTIEMSYIVLSGITGSKTEESSVRIQTKSGKETIIVRYSPKNLVADIIKQVLEIMIYRKKINDKLTIQDVHLKLGDDILDSWKHTAEYSKLARSFFCYNLQDDFINHDSIFKPFIKRFGDYYQMILLGERDYTTDQLEMCLEKPHVSTINQECATCNHQYNSILPCCRKKVCHVCLKNCTSNNSCSFCKIALT
jgi:hypothetical protein